MGATDDERATNSEASPTPFIHSWVERGATVYSPTQIEREGELIPWPKAFYYETNGVTDAHMIKRPALLKISGEIGLSAHLRLDRPLKTNASFVFGLLDTVGLLYAGPHMFEPNAASPRGVGQHPHRGFETVTIVYDGEVSHKDSSGGGGTIGTGDVQWMTARAASSMKNTIRKDFPEPAARSAWFSCGSISPPGTR